MMLTDTDKQTVVDELQEAYKHNMLELCMRVPLVARQIKPSGQVIMNIDNLGGSALDPKALGLLFSKLPQITKV